MIAKRAQHRGQLIDSGATTAKLCRYAGLDQSGRFQQCKIIGDEFVLVGRFVGALPKNCSQVARNVVHRASFSRIGVDGFDHVYDIFLLLGMTKMHGFSSEVLFRSSPQTVPALPSRPDTRPRSLARLAF